MKFLDSIHKTPIVTPSTLLGFTSAAAAYAFIGGVITLLGWALNVPGLTDWISSGISMFPNPAVCAVLSGVTLLLLNKKGNNARRTFSRILASIVATIGGLTLFEHISGLSLGVDTALFDRPWGQAASTAPMRMGPPASISFAILGVGLFLATCSSRKRKFASALSIVPIAIASLSLVGYWYRADQLFGVARLTGIALQTSTMIAALGLGLTAALPEMGLPAILSQRDAGGVVARRLLVPIVTIPLLFGWLRLLAQKAGLFDVAFGVAAMVLTTVIMFVVLLWWTASSISRHAQITLVAEEAIRRSEARLKSAMEVGGLGTWDWNIRLNKLTWIEPSHRSHTANLGIFENTFEAFLGLVHPDDRGAVDTALDKALHSSASYELEFRIPDPIHGTRWIYTRAEVMRDRDGQPERMIGITQDVTERRKVADAQLQARLAAEEANRAKDEFLAMLSHELRTPLNSILGWAVILRTRHVPIDRANHALEVIERNARVEAELVESLLDLSRIAAGKLQLHKERVDLLSIINTVVDSFRPATDEKRITLSVELPSASVILDGDHSRLQQIFSNLISNAVKFTPNGGLINVRLNRMGSKARIDIADNGEGIHPDLLPHVFDRFRQAESTTSRAHGGLGLGLAIVKELVDAHGGNVVVTSDGKGRGSRFTVTLPVPPLPADIEMPRPQSACDEEPSITGLRVLVVDDDPDARELVALTLQTAGATIQSASSAADALNSIMRDRPDAIIADIGMPHEDGYVLIQKLRAHERKFFQRRIPAIALTGYASAADRDQALAAGYDDHLAKPVGPADLIHAMAKFLVITRSRVQTTQT